MKSIRLLFVAFLAVFSIIGCARINPVITEATDRGQLAPGATYLSKTKIDSLKNATARYEAYNPEGKLKWTGTAWAFYQGKTHSVWMTCRHVANDSGEAKIIYKDASGVYMAGNVLALKVHDGVDSEDMAVFLSDAKPASVMKLASEELEDSLKAYYSKPQDYSKKPPILMASSGHFAGIFPAVVTVGVFQGYSDIGINTSVGGWYGVSGSAIVDLNSMSVVGMQYRFAERYRSDNIAGVPVSTIKEFLSTVDGLED